MDEALAALEVARLWYGQHVLSHAFSGFLAVSGFIFSMHSFIIAKMKEGVYDTVEYRKELELSSAKNLTPVPLYKNLSRLNQRLLGALYCCLAATVGQFVFGYIPIVWLIAPLLFVAGFVALLLAVLALRENMKSLFERLDQVHVEAVSGDQGVVDQTNGE